MTTRRVLPAVLGFALLAATACRGDGMPSPTPTAATREPATATASPTTASRTPSSTPSAIGSPSRTPTPGATGGPASSATPPAGYASSCAKDVPWGRQVSKPFICLDSPAPATHVARGGTVTITGYAGGSFEHNVVNEVHALIDREPGVQLVMRAVTYTAPDVGMPGTWRVQLTIPATAPVGTARVIAHFDSPRDGSVVAQATVDIVVD